MDTVTILRRLWRFRLFVVVIAVFAIGVGAFISYDLPTLKSRKYTVGVGSARILVDTPASQVVDLSPEGSDSVSARAALLSSLMVDGEIKNAIAREAGLRPDQLTGVNQNAGPAVKSSVPARDRFVLSPQVTMISNNTWLPIIEVSTQAPTAEQAGKLANAAIKGLTDYLDSKAAQEAIPGAKRLQVSGLGAADAHDETQGPSLMLSLVATLALFVVGCGVLLGVVEVVRALRNDPQPAVASRNPPASAQVDAGSAHPLVAPQPPASPAAKLYALDQRREQVRDADEHAEAINDKQPAAAAGAPAPPPSQDRAGWWGGGPR